MPIIIAKRVTLILWGTTGVLGCAQVPTPVVSVLTTSDQQVSTRPLSVRPHPVQSQRTQRGPSPVPGLAQHSVTRQALDRSYFYSHEFKRRFALSFLSVHDVEPSTTPDEAEELREIIELIQTDSKRVRALKKLEAAVNDTSSANYPYLIGQIHLGDDRPDLAMGAYLEAVDRAPNFRRAWSQIALLHYRLAIDPDNEAAAEDYSSCARAFGRAISLGQIDGMSYGMMAISLLKTGKVLAAESAFRQAIMMSPDEKQWVMGLAQCFFQSKRFGDAVALFDGLIADEPNNPDYWLNQGNAYLGLKNPDMAGRHFQIAEQLGGGTAASTTTLADIYVNNGLSDIAVPAYLRALKLDEQATPDRGIRAARLMTGRGEVDSAKSLLAGIEAHFGDHLADTSVNEMLKLRAKIAVREGRDGDQIEVLREIINRDPLDGDGMILLAQALSRAGQIDEALLNFETAASIDGFEGEAKLQHARVLVSEKRFAEAVPLLKASLQSNNKQTVRTYLEGVEKAARRAVD